MPLGAFRINSLAKVLSTPPIAFTEAIRTPIGIDAVGNANISSTQYKFGNTSLYLDGNGDSINCDPTNLQLGSGDWTIEFFYYPTSLTAGTRLILDCRDADTDPSRINTYFNSATTFLFRSGTTTVISASHGMTVNNWYHWAFVKSGSTITAYINGSSVGSGSDSTTFASDNFIIGQYFGGGDFGMIGYIDEYRVSDTARYTSSFTVSTTPFTNDSNTLLLMHADGTNGATTIVDDTGDRARLGVNADGGADVERTVNAKFSNSAIGLDANGDIIKPSRTDLGDILNDGDYTIEAWVRHDSVASVDYIFSNRKTTFGVFGWVLSMRGDVAGDPFEFLTSGYTGITGSTSIQHQNGASANTWYHVALVRSGDIVTMYVDGVASTTTINLSGSSYAPSDQLWFGSNGNTATQMLGYMDEIRVSDVARYTTGFTPPTERFTSDANTLLLIHGIGTNGSQNLYDDNSATRAPHSVAAIANAQYSTTQSKFGTTSIYCDGTGDYVFAADATGGLDFGTGDFTIEWFQYKPTLDLSAVDMRNGSNGAKILLYSSPNDNVILYVNSADRITSGSVLSANTWQHICLCRESGSTRLYVDGTQVGSTYADTTNYEHDSIYIFYNSLSGSYDGQGYINEFRISDTARYSGASLTVPTARFKHDNNTRLLIHGEGTATNNHLFDDNSAFFQ